MTWREGADHVFTQAGTGMRLAASAALQASAGFYRRDDLTFASSIAYYTLLSLFPFSLLAFSALGSVTADDADRAKVIAFALRFFPQQSEFVATQIDALRTTRMPIGLLGGAATLWAALGVFGAITSAVNHAWGVAQQPSYFKHKLVSFLMLVAASLLLLLTLLVFSAISVAETSWFASILALTPGLVILRSLALEYAATLLLIFIVGLVFYFVPNTKVRFRDVWVGAIITGLLWRGALLAFSWYVRDMSRFSVHGSIAAVIVFLLWVYLSAVILLYGVEFTAAYAKLRMEKAALVMVGRTEADVVECRGA